MKNLLLKNQMKTTKDINDYFKIYSSINNAGNITEIRNNLRMKKFKFGNKKVNKLLELSKITVISFYNNNKLYVAKCENHKKLHYIDKSKFKIKSLKVFNYVD